jgi:hypothetical protein
VVGDPMTAPATCGVNTNVAARSERLPVTTAVSLQVAPELRLQPAPEVVDAPKEISV